MKEIVQKANVIKLLVWCACGDKTWRSLLKIAVYLISQTLQKHGQPSGSQLVSSPSRVHYISQCAQSTSHLYDVVLFF